MTDIRKFPLIFESVIESVRAEWDVDNNVLPIYEFGTYLQLTKSFTFKDKQDSPKYPLVWLVWEASESRRSYQGDLIAEISPRIFIATYTDSNYTSKERYAANFEAILYPIWDLILQKMNDHNQIGNVYMTDYDDYDHLYWGESLGYQKKKNVLFDTLDALEIKFTNSIRILKSTC